jgi:uncharacterized protein (TIGR02145 family)
MKKLNLITTLIALLIVWFGCKKETPKETPTCSFVYSAWTPCSNNIQTRTYTSSPSGCTGTPPADSTQRSCVVRKIGNQIWTLKNLDVATYRNGDVILQVKNRNDWVVAGGLKIGAWCYYENDSSYYGTTYGKLYNWYAVNDPRGLAPNGYHIPTDAEWTTLTTYLGGASFAGRKMKESGTSHWRIEEFTDATNSSGFTGLPGGYRDNIDGHFGHMNAYGFWWSSSEFNTGNAWSRNLCYAFDNASRNNDGKQNGYSVRCIKD